MLNLVGKNIFDIKGVYETDFKTFPQYFSYAHA